MDHHHGRSSGWVPPFTLGELETALAGRPGIPADDLRLTAAQVYRRYGNSGPAGTTWRVRTIEILTTTGGGGAMYDLCRADWAGGVFLSAARRTVQAVADALNELEGLSAGEQDPAS